MAWLSTLPVFLIAFQGAFANGQSTVSAVQTSHPSVSVSGNASQQLNDNYSVKTGNATLRVEVSGSRNDGATPTAYVTLSPSQPLAQPSGSAGAQGGAAENSGSAQVTPNPSQSLVIEIPVSLLNTTTAPQQTAGHQGSTAGAISPSHVISAPKASATPSQAAATTKPMCCSDVDWTKDLLESCGDEKCVKEQLSSATKRRKCAQQKPKNATVPEMRTLVEKIGFSLAESIIRALDKDSTYNTSLALVVGDIALSAGVVDSKVYNTSKKKFLTIPQDFKAFTGQWREMTESVSIPITVLPPNGKSVYVWASVDDFSEDRKLTSTEMDWDDNIIAESDISELYVEGNKLLSRRRVPDKRINSRAILFSLKKPDNKLLKGPFREPAKITFKHKKGGSGFSGPACAWWDEDKWSRDGLDVRETNSTHTVCKLEHFSVFSVIMKVEEKVDYSEREFVVTLATVLGSLSLLFLLLCFIVIIGVGYHQPDQMRIALNIDVALVLGHLVFFIGLATTDNMYFASINTCKVIAPFQQLFELAALSWLLMEGLHYLNTLRPFINDSNTVPIAFYFALGWGIPAAVASACADFSYPHFGTPEASEFCWLFIRGSSAWYFGGPVVMLVLLNIVVRAWILKEVVTWRGEPDDLKIERAKARLVSFVVLILCIVLAWMFGVLAVNNTDKKAFHYVFLVFFMLQGLAVFVFYSVKNDELKTYYKEKKEEEHKRETATVSFEYVP